MLLVRSFNFHPASYVSSYKQTRDTCARVFTANELLRGVMLLKFGPLANVSTSEGGSFKSYLNLVEANIVTSSHPQKRYPMVVYFGWWHATYIGWWNIRYMIYIYGPDPLETLSLLNCNPSTGVDSRSNHCGSDSSLFAKQGHCWSRCPKSHLVLGEKRQSCLQSMQSYKSFWHLWDKKVDSIGHIREMRFVSWALALAWNTAMELVAWKSSWRFCWSNAFVSSSVVLKCQTQAKWTMAWDVNMFEAIGMRLKITWMRRNFLLLWMLDCPWANIKSIGKRLSFNCLQLD